MAKIKPFKAIRPNNNYIKDVVSLPYDVVSRDEVKQEIEGKPHSFLRISRSDGALESSIGSYDSLVYEKAKATLEQFISEGILTKDSSSCFYVYRQKSDKHSQTGLVSLTSVDEYHNDLIKKHEKTREAKENDRTKHIDVLETQCEPVFLTHRPHAEMKVLIEKIQQSAPIASVEFPQGVQNEIWAISPGEDQKKLEFFYQEIPCLYIADGHHRAASANRVGKTRQEADTNKNGNEPYNFFLSILFPSDELMLLPYNRVVKDLGTHSKESFLSSLEKHFEITIQGSEKVWPTQPRTFGLYMDGTWYLLELKKDYPIPTDPVGSLDVSLLQNLIFDSLLGIKDPRMDSRLDFVGGIRGAEELEKRVNSKEMTLAFSLYPTSINALMKVADKGLLMPPKSTWFEPKITSGLFLHSLKEEVK